MHLGPTDIFCLFLWGYFAYPLVKMVVVDIHKHRNGPIGVLIVLSIQLFIMLGVFWFPVLLVAVHNDKKSL